MSARRVGVARRYTSIAHATVPPSAILLMGGCRGVRGGHMTALVIGLVSIAVVWLVVIYGSIYVNKNVQ